MAGHVDIRNLKRVREILGVSQRDLAEASGISRRSIQRYEQGEVQPSYERAEYIASFLGHNAEDIIGVERGCDCSWCRHSCSSDTHRDAPDNMEREERLRKLEDSIDEINNALREIRDNRPYEEHSRGGMLRKVIAFFKMGDTRPRV